MSKYIPAMLLALLLATAAQAQLRPAAVSPQETAWALATTAMQAMEWDDAVDALQPLVAQPTWRLPTPREEATLALATSLRQTGNISEARKVLASLLKAHPRDRWTPLVCAQVTALALAETPGQGLAPLLAEALRGHAWSCDEGAAYLAATAEALGCTDMVIAAVDAFLAEHGADKRAMLWRAAQVAFLAQRLEFDTALALGEKLLPAVGGEPCESSLRFAMAEAYARTGKPDQAELLLNPLAARKQPPADTSVRMTEYRQQAVQIARCREALARPIATTLDDPGMTVTEKRAFLTNLAALTPGAIYLLDAALNAYYPGHPADDALLTVKRAHAQLWADAGNHRKAAALGESLLADAAGTPRQRDVARFLATEYGALGQSARGGGLLYALATCEPPDTSLLAASLACYRQAGDTEHVGAAMTVLLNEKNPPAQVYSALYWLGRRALAAGHRDEGVRWLTTLSSRVPELPIAMKARKYLREVSAAR